MSYEVSSHILISWIWKTENVNLKNTIELKVIQELLLIWLINNILLILTIIICIYPEHKRNNNIRNIKE